ncbi:alpha amylase [Fischerella thermalis 111/344/542]|nr:alpha amylase [Fischerella thermalis 111/344/542]
MVANPPSQISDTQYTVENPTAEVEAIVKTPPSDTEIDLEFLYTDDGVKIADFNDNQDHWYHQYGEVTNWEDEWQVHNCELSGLATFNENNIQYRNYIKSAIKQWLDRGVDGNITINILPTLPPYGKPRRARLHTPHTLHTPNSHQGVEKYLDKYTHNDYALFSKFPRSKLNAAIP